MKALTIKQPWAWAMFAQELAHPKDIENRDWSTQLRGTIAVHTSKHVRQFEAVNAFQLSRYHKLIETVPPTTATPNGVIIGLIEIYDCVDHSDSPWFMGEYGFVLRNPCKLSQPIACNGALGFWELPQEIEAKILRNLEIK